MRISIVSLLICIGLMVFSSTISGEEIRPSQEIQIVNQTGDNFSELFDLQEIQDYSEYILGNWKEYNLSEKLDAICGLITWGAAYVGYIAMAAAAGGPIGLIIFGILILYISCFVGAMCLGEIFS